MTDIRRHLLETLPRIIAHRGASGEAPENTLAAIRLAHARGARWVEVDVKLSSDRRCFLLHDATVDRTTNGAGRANRLTWDHLSTLDAGRFRGPAFAGQRLPDLAAFISVLGELGMGANIEIKPSPGMEVETGELVAAETMRLWPEGLPLPLLSSFADTSLLAARRVAPDLPRGLLVNRWHAGIPARMTELECHSLHIGHSNLDSAILAALREDAIPVLCFTVNDGRRAAELIRAGATSIITDWPAEIGDSVNSV